MEYFTGKVIIQPPGGRGMGLAKIGGNIPSHSEGLEITDLDPEGVGSAIFPRAIEVQTNDEDGAKLLALWHGDFGLLVGDFVRCRKDPSSPILIIEGLGGDTAAKGGSGVWPEPGKCKIGTTEYATLALASAAASSGETILIGVGSHTVADLSLTAGVNLKGAGRGVTILTSGAATAFILGLSGTVFVSDLSVTNTKATGSYADAIRIFASAVVTLINVGGAGTTGGASTSDGCSLISAANGIVATTLTAIDCSFSGTSGFDSPVIGSSAQTVKLYGCTLNGPTYGDIYNASTGAVIAVQDCTLTNGTITKYNGAGTINGHYSYNDNFRRVNSGSFSITLGGTDQTGIVTSTFTKINFTTEEFDRDGWFDNVTNYRYTPQVAGDYQINLQVTMLSIADGARVLALIYKNGTRFKNGRAGTGVTATTGVSCNAVVNLNGTTDYVSFYVFHTHGSNRDIEGDTFDTHASGFLVAAV